MLRSIAAGYVNALSMQNAIENAASISTKDMDDSNHSPFVSFGPNLRWGNLYDVPNAETHAEITPTDADIDAWVLDHGVDFLAAFDEL